MNTHQLLELSRILQKAETARKADYRTYERLKKEVDALTLRPNEYDSAIRKLAKALGV